MQRKHTVFVTLRSSELSGARRAMLVYSVSVQASSTDSVPMRCSPLAGGQNCYLKTLTGCALPADAVATGDATIFMIGGPDCAPPLLVICSPLFSFVLLVCCPLCCTSAGHAEINGWHRSSSLRRRIMYVYIYLIVYLSRGAHVTQGAHVGSGLCLHAACNGMYGPYYLGMVRFIFSHVAVLIHLKC